MGGDFNYQSASSWFLNLDSLIKYTNEIAERRGLNINVFYSTPACYMKAVEDANVTFTTKKDDFFPYASDPTAYWTGYFTSRPTTKYYERQSNAVLQMFKQLIVLTGSDDKARPVLEEFKSAMGMMQHHDAITGTEKQHVANDYVKILHRVNTKADALISGFFSSLLNDNEHVYNDRCQLNISSCETTMHSQFSFAAYNPLAWTVTEYLNIPVPNKDNFEIYDPNGDKVDYSILAITDDIKSIPKRLNQNYLLVFPITLPPLSLSTYFVKKIKTKSRRTVKYNQNNFHNEHKPIYDKENNIYDKIPNSLPKIYASNYDFDINVLKNKYEPNADIAMLEKIIMEAKSLDGKKFLKHDEAKRFDDKKFEYNFSKDEQRMLGDDPTIIEAPSSRNIIGNNKKSFKPQFSNTNLLSNLEVYMGRYNSCSGDNYKQRASGAYIFRPNGTLIQLEGQITNYNDEKVYESYFKLEENCAFKLRSYHSKVNYTEVFWTVGPISINDKIGKEYVIVYNTNWLTNGVFETDSNGREMIRRKLNYQPEFNITLKEPKPGNYYPITNRISIESEDTIGKFTVLTDRSEGASSSINGDVEIMVHRRMLYDDGFGVGEALNETEHNIGLIVTGRHRLYASVNMAKPADVYVKQLAIQTDLEPKIYFSKADSLTKWRKTIKQISFVNEFPIGLHLLTLESWRENELLLRLENYSEKSDRDITDVKINLKNIFKGLNVNWYRETYLAASKWKGEFNDNDFDVTLKAKEIKTFVVGYSFK